MTLRTTKIVDDVRLIVAGGKKTRPLYLVEQAPKHQLTYCHRNMYSLPLPWVYYIIIYNDTYQMYTMFCHNFEVRNKVMVKAAYCSPKKIRNVTDTLDWLPTVASAPHQVCDYGVEIEPKTKRDILIHKALEHFWAANGSTWLALPSELQKQLSPSLKDEDDKFHCSYAAYNEWEKHSLEDVLAMDYGQLVTMGELIDQVKNDTCEAVTKY